MLTNFDKVCEFHDSFGVSIPTAVDELTDEDRELNFKLLIEEVAEIADAYGYDFEYSFKRNSDKPINLVEAVDGYTDVLYIAYGRLDSHGVNADACFEEVHSSNMSKLDENGKPIFSDGSDPKYPKGKIMKPAGYKKPNLAKVIYG